MSQFMLVMSQQFTLGPYTRTKVPSFYEQIWQLTLENSHELQITADFIVIVETN